MEEIRYNCPNCVYKPYVKGILMCVLSICEYISLKCMKMHDAQDIQKLPFMLVLTSEHRLVLCVCMCVFCPHSVWDTKTKTTQPGRRNTHLHPNSQRRHSCDSVNAVSFRLSLILSFFLSFFPQTMSDMLTHYNLRTISILHTEASLFSVWETVGGNSVNHSECCHSEGSRGTFTV